MVTVQRRGDEYDELWIIVHPPDQPPPLPPLPKLKQKKFGEVYEEHQKKRRR